MDYGKRGVIAKQRAFHSKSGKWGRKMVITCLKVLLVAVIGIGILGASAGIGMFKGIIASTPSINLNDIAPTGQATRIYDSEGNEIDKYVSSNSNRIIVSMEKIPENLAHAFVAIEDERFYEHNGIDIKGMMRAAYQFVKTGGSEAQGASTITQQLLKNLIFTEWTSEGDNVIKKVKRKLQEQYLALEVSKVMTKDDILEQYMNTINLGQNTLGVEAASQRYFGKTVSDLTLSECAVIASITQNPTKYNPLKYPEYNAVRRKTCLDNMLDLEFITQTEYEQAMLDSEDVYVRIDQYNQTYSTSTSRIGSYFSDALQKQVLEDMVAAGYSETMASSMLLSGGLKIFSTLDPKIQAIVDEEVANEGNYPDNVKWYLNYALTVNHTNGESTNYSQENMKTYFQENINKEFNLIFSSQEAAQEAVDTYIAAMVAEDETYDETMSMTVQPQVSVTIINQETGYVLAIAGGRGDKVGRLTLNRATDTVRQPGSTFKIVAAYAAALDSAGLTLASVYEDAPYNYEGGRPISNWYSGYRGITTIRTAIAQSMNIIAVKTLTQITPQLGYDYLLNFGFTTLTTGKVVNGKTFTDVNQTLSLGGITNGVKNLELCASYATIANGGVYVTPKFYTKVVDSDGNVILDNTSPETRQVIKATTAFLLTNAMQDVVTTGTGSRASFPNMAIAGKTGTTTDNRDVWFAGYTPYYTCATWAGYDNNLVMSSSAGNNETAIARTLWRSIMSRVHEDLPGTTFSTPNGIVSAHVCSVSGKLAIPGLCSTTSEYFAEGTVPIESCDIHYQGSLCAYDGLPASPECPFKYEGVLTLSLIEDTSLWSGYPNGQPSITTNTCQHNAEFYADPNYETVISQQQWEISQRNAATPAAEGTVEDGSTQEEVNPEPQG